MGIPTARHKSLEDQATALLAADGYVEPSVSRDPLGRAMMFPSAQAIHDRLHAKPRNMRGGRRVKVRGRVGYAADA